MRSLQPGRGFRGRIWVGCLLAAVAAGAVATGQAAAAAPLSSAAVSAKSQLATDGGGGTTSSGQVSWSVFPATSKGPDSTRNLFSYGVVKAGSSIVDHVEIVNRSKQSAAFSIYAADAAGTTAAGSLLLQTGGQKPTDIGAWASFPGGAAELSTIIPDGKAIIEPFTINVPLQATPGDHTGGLVAAVGVPKRNSAGVLVVQNYRIVVPIELRVPGALHAGLQVQSISTGFSDPLNPFGSGSATVSYTVTNTGNVRQSGAQAVTVTGPFGQAATVRPPLLPTILPGDSIRVSVALAGLFPDGPMSANVAVKPGWPPQTIRLPQTAPEATGSASLFAMPWSIIGLVLLLVAIGVGIWYLFRWRGRLRRAELSAVAARARRDTERQLLGRRAAANGHGAGPEADPATAASPSGRAEAASASGPAEVESASAEAAATSVTPDGGSATPGSAPE
jgi:hypothetical protein